MNSKVEWECEASGGICYILENEPQLLLKIQIEHSASQVSRELNNTVMVILLKIQHNVKIHEREAKTRLKGRAK